MRDRAVSEWIGDDKLGLFTQLGVIGDPWPTAGGVFGSDLKGHMGWSIRYLRHSKHLVGLAKTGGQLGQHLLSH